MQLPFFWGINIHSPYLGCFFWLPSPSPISLQKLGRCQKTWEFYLILLTHGISLVSSRSRISMWWGWIFPQVRWGEMLQGLQGVHPFFAPFQHRKVRDGFVVGAGFWGFVGSSWQQMFIFCTVMPSYACCQRYCCKISSIWYIYIYIYMHTSKISSSWVTRNNTYCTCTARNYITLSTVLCHLASEYQREKFNFALLRHAQMIGFCLLLCCRFL